MSSAKKSRKNRCLKAKHLPKNIQWMHDFDYLAKLPAAEQKWMNKFIDEYYDANVKKGDRRALHNSKRLRLDCYNRRNAQNRDLQSIMDSKGRMDRVAGIENPMGSGKSFGVNRGIKKFSEDH